MMQRRIVSFANSSVAIEFDGERAARIVDFLFHDASADETIFPHRTFRVMLDKATNQLLLLQDSTLVLASDSDASIADLLLGQVSFHLANVSRGGLVFHAGAADWRGKTVLLPGGIGAGKTTLTAWLISKGLDYLTDELVFAPNDADSIHAFPRPLSLKERRVAHTFLDFEKNAATILSSLNGDLIPTHILQPAHAHVPHPIGLILFPHYQSDGTAKIVSLSHAQTAFHLLACLINARNLADYGVPQVVRLSKLVPAYRLSYSGFKQIEKQVDSWLASVVDEKNVL